MARGGYNGGSTVVGFSGSGWTGSGSVTMQPAAKRTSAGGKPKKKAAADRVPQIPATLNDDEEIQRTLKRLKAVEKDIASATRRLEALKSQLGHVRKELQVQVANKRAEAKRRVRTGL